MRKIRIVYTIPNFDTAGSGIALLKLVTRIDRQRFEPCIVCMHDRGALFQTIRNCGVPVHIHPYLTPQRPRYRFLRGILQTSRFFRSLGADIVFSYHYAPDLSEVFAARLSGARFLYVKKNMGWNGPSRKQWRIKTWLAHAITVQNRDMLDMFFKGMRKARIISIGVDRTEFRPTDPDDRLRDEILKGSRDRIILCVANLVPKKGIPYLIEAFSRSAHRDTCRLVIVGNHDTPLWEETCRQITRLGVDGRVSFMGKRSDVNRFYSVADLFILPSTGDEGAPIVVQEAMASGVPVLSTSVPGNRDQLEELPAQLVPPCNPDALLAAMDRMLSLDKQGLERIRELQMSILERRYSLENEVLMHEQLYCEILNHRPITHGHLSQ
jgi:glycosyltransferase involved in cell wall biosynthesis